jgi:hypothetical protein
MCGDVAASVDRPAAAESRSAFGRMTDLRTEVEPLGDNSP